MRSADDLGLVVGEEAHVPLAGPHAAGYEWEWSVAGDVGAIALRRAQRPAAGGAPTSDGIDHTLLVRGVAPGRATIHLMFRRVFEPGSPPARTRTLTIEVT